VLLLSIPARVEGGNGHDSGSGLSAVVEHHGTMAGLRQEQRQEINGGKKVALACWLTDGVVSWQGAATMSSESQPCSG
jgi:hypothetical protein